MLQAELERLEGLQGKTSDISFGKAHVLYELGELSMSTDRKTAKNYYQKSLSLYDALGDERGQALVLISLGEALHHTGPLDQAQKYLERGIVLCRKLGDPRMMARCIYWSGWNFIRQGSFSEGEALVRESIEINRSIGDRYAEAFYCAELGRVVGWSGHLRESLELLSQSIGIYHELNLKQEATFILQVKGLVEQILLELAPARQDLQTGVFASYQQKYLRGIGGGMYGLGCISLSEGDLQKAEELFLQAIPILRDVQADEEGWCVALLVFTLRGMNQPQRAWQYARQALEIGLKAQVFLTAALTIRGIAILLADEGQAERAIELHELTMHHPVIERGPFYQALSVPLIDQISANLPHEVVAAARQRGQKRDMFVTAEELLGEISSRSLVA